MSSMGQSFPDTLGTAGVSDAYRLVQLGIPPDRAVRVAAAARDRQASAGPGAPSSGVNQDQWDGFPDAGATDQAEFEPAAFRLTARDKSYLDRYAPAVIAHSKTLNVYPALPLGVGLLESSGATDGTYKRTNDAFGMTNNGTDHMSRFPAGPSGVGQDVQRFFDLYGRQIQGVGSDEGAFCNALQGADPSGRPVPGWRRYNSINGQYCDSLHKNIRSMQHALDTWRASQPGSASNP